MTIDKKLVEAFVAWTIGENDDKTRLGSQLEKYIDDLPVRFKRSPSNILYRCILVSDDLLKKVRMQNKPLILKNRKYSSWTYDLEASKNFSNVAQYYLATYQKTFVVLRKSFPDSQILLNVEAFGRYLGELNIDTLKQLRDIERLYVAIHMAGMEKEIVVKNITSDFTFAKHNIFLYKENNKQWRNF